MRNTSIADKSNVSWNTTAKMLWHVVEEKEAEEGAKKIKMSAELSPTIESTDLVTMCMLGVFLNEGKISDTEELVTHIQGQYDYSGLN